MATKEDAKQVGGPTGLDKAQKTKNVRLLALDGLMAALGVLLMFVLRVPLFPGVAPWLIYEMGDVPAIIAGLMAGPAHGLLVLLVICLVQLVTPMASGIYGLFMHFLASGLLVLIPALLWKRKKTNLNLILGLVLGSVAMTLIMIPMNLIITPLFTNAPVEAVKALLLPAIIPFNLIKACLNSVISFVVFLALKRVFKSKLN
jgi:riboflavin transporter FmnP